MGLWTDLETAINEHEGLVRAIRANNSAMLRLLQGNLQGADAEVLRALKNDLRRFNSTTGKWRAPR